MLSRDVDDQVQSLCMEIQFATTGTGVVVDNLFIVHVDSSAKNDVYWGAAYNYDGSGESVWKRNSFQGLLPSGANRKVCYQNLI